MFASRGFLVLLGLLASAAPALADSRVEIPITQRKLSNGEIRFTTMIQIGAGRPIEAMIDTGSTGLRVMNRALTPSQYESTNKIAKTGYGSGVVLSGIATAATVKIGPLALSAPVTIQVVKSVTCSQAKPNCPASRIAAEAYGIGGDGLANEGYDAILGIKPLELDKANAVTNPLLSSESKRWIVVLPTPKATGSGKLIVNPSAGDLAGFRPVQIQDMGSLDIPNCLDKPLDQQARCPKMHIDTGARSGIAPFYSHALLFDAGNRSLSAKAR